MMEGAGVADKIEREIREEKNLLQRRHEKNSKRKEDRTMIVFDAVRVSPGGEMCRLIASQRLCFQSR